MKRAITFKTCIGMSYIHNGGMYVGTCFVLNQIKNIDTKFVFEANSRLAVTQLEEKRYLFKTRLKSIKFQESQPNKRTVSKLRCL